MFRAAHAELQASLRFKSDGEPVLTVRSIYHLRDREITAQLDGTHLLSAAGAPSMDIVRSLGPFEVTAYWFNRPLLEEVKGVLGLEHVKSLQEAWAGGLMLYRDGFRVNPYGALDDDWLSLDKKALASSGYKVNRRQIIGKVDITSRLNPGLADQSNREGLRSSPERDAFVSLLRHVLEVQFRRFLNNVDNEVRALEPVTFDDLERRVDVQVRDIRQTLKSFVRKNPKASAIATPVQASLKELQRTLDEAKELAASYQKGRSQLVHLAGLGLLVEILVHELSRATLHALRTIEGLDGRSPSKPTVSTLRAQLKTLQKRLSVLDPVSTSGRQVKEAFDLVEWVEEILQAHDAQFKRHGIEFVFEVVPSQHTLQVKVVKGMIVQILENLVSNSVYWLKQQSRMDPSFVPRIRVAVDVSRSEVHVSDNGPGIPRRLKEQVFQPFMTTKPPGLGKGLGLYISREIAEYNGASLVLDQSESQDASLHTFVLRLNGGSHDS